MFRSSFAVGFSQCCFVILICFLHQNAAWIYNSGGGDACFSNPLGMQSSKIPSSSITVSSTKSGYSVDDIRLPSGSSYDTFCFNKHGDPHWVLIDLGSVHYLCGIASKGKHHKYTKKYKMVLSVNQSNTFTYETSNGDQNIKGNKRKDTKENTRIEEKAVRYVKLIIIDYDHNPCTTVELYGRSMPNVTEPRNVPLGCYPTSQLSRSVFNMLTNVAHMPNSVEVCCRMCSGLSRNVFAVSRGGECACVRKRSYLNEFYVSATLNQTLCTDGKGSSTGGNVYSIGNSTAQTCQRTFSLIKPTHQTLGNNTVTCPPKFGCYGEIATISSLPPRYPPWAKPPTGINNPHGESYIVSLQSCGFILGGQCSDVCSALRNKQHCDAWCCARNDCDNRIEEQNVTFEMEIKAMKSFPVSLLNQTTLQYNMSVQFYERLLRKKLSRYILLDVKVLNLRPGSIIVAAVITTTSTHRGRSIKDRVLRMLQGGAVEGVDFYDSPFLWQATDLNTSCCLPTLNITNLERANPDLATSLTTGQTIKINTSVTYSNCTLPLPQALVHQWVVKPIVGETVGYTHALMSNNQTIEIRSNALRPGLYLVEYSVRCSYTMLYPVYGYINVTGPRLEAVIAGGPNISRYASGALTFDASPSRDYTVDAGNYNGFGFLWLCKKAQEQFRRSHYSSPPVIAPGSRTDLGGCFGTGIGRLGYTGRQATIDLSAMQPGLYDIMVIVTKAFSKSTFVQQLEILRGNPPVFTIRCLENCGSMVSITMEFKLKTECTKSCYNSIKYEWMLQKYSYDGKPTWSYVSKLKQMINPQKETDFLTFKATALDGYNSYRLIVKGPALDNSYGFAFRGFTTNAPPKGGNCSVSPEEGRALETKFTFECTNWTDPQKPLTYEIKVKQSSGAWATSCRGVESSCSNKMLPSGLKASQFYVTVVAIVRDSLNVATQRTINIKVMPPDFTGTSFQETISSLTNGGISSLQRSGKVQESLALAATVLDSMATAPTEAMPSEQMTKVKEAIASQLSSIPIKSLGDVVSLGSVVISLTSNTDQVSLTTQRKCLSMLEKMTNFLTNVKSDSSNEELIKEGQQNLVGGIGNVMKSAVRRVGGSDANADKQSKAAVKSGLVLVDKVVGQISNNSVTDAPETNIITSFLALSIGKHSPGQLAAKKIGIGYAGCTLPSDTSQIIGRDSSAPVVTQVKVFAFNPYNEDKSASDVSSDVVSIDLKTSAGSEMPVSGLSSLLDIRVPIKVPGEQNSSDSSYFVKAGEKSRMRFHKIKVLQKGKAIRLEIQAMENAKLDIYIRKKFRPTTTLYDYKQTIPSSPSCATKQDETIDTLTCTDDPITVFLPDVKIGTWYAGIHRTVSQTRKRRSCFGNGREKRSCVEEKEIAKFNPSSLLYDPDTDVNYTINVQQPGCYYWSPEENKWLGLGCRAGPQSTSTSLQCLCNHLTSFGGNMFVAPNPIDFDKVFLEMSRMGESGNVAVLAVIITIWLVYVLVVIVVKRADRRDLFKIGPPITINLTSHDSSGCTYEMSIATGIWRNAGTTSEVTMVISGSDANSDNIVICSSDVKPRIILARGNSDSFLIRLPNKLGDLKRLQVWHNNFGDDPSWFLSNVVIKELATEASWTFPCNRWLAVEKDDGSTMRSLHASKPGDLSQFKHSFNSKRSQNFAEGHLWLSVMTKPPTNMFTRVQRATCCLSLLFSVMVVNAMFYNLGSSVESTFQVGPFKFSWRQIMVGVQSSLIVAPVNLLIITLFKKSTKRNYEKPSIEIYSDLKTKNDPRRPSSIPILDNDSPSKCGTVDSEDVKPEIETDDNQSYKKKAFALPRWCIYIGWVLCLLTVGISATFTFFYSLMWGKEIAEQWLTSICVSFVKDVFVIQPVKIIVLALIVSLILHKRGKKKRSDDAEESQDKDEEKLPADRIYSVQEKKRLRKARKLKKKEIASIDLLKEALEFFLFFFLLSTVAYGSITNYRYIMASSISSSLDSFKKVTSTETFWSWLSMPFLSAMYAGTWYNGEVELTEQYVGDKSSIVLGIPQLRQLRIKNGSCSFPNLVAPYFNDSSCLGKYSILKEDTTPYNLPGWTPLASHAHWANLSKLCPKPWQYASGQSLDNLPSWGYYTLYGGGGYVADLGYHANTAINVINKLKRSKWIDRNTRAIILQLSIFNTNINLLAVATYMFEILPVGGITTFHRMYILPLTSNDAGFHEFYLFCQLFFLIVVIIKLFSEIRKLFRLRFSYFKNLWSWIQLILVFSSLSGLVCHFIKTHSVSKYFKLVKENPYAVVRFQKAVAWAEAEIIAYSLALFCATMKFLRLMRYNKHISVLISTFRAAKNDLISFSVIMFVIMLAFAQLANIALGSNLYSFSTLMKSCYSELLMALGGSMNIEDLSNTNRILGPLFGFGFITSMAFLFLNMFVAILNDSYYIACESTDKKSAELEMADFLMTKFYGLVFGRRPERKIGSHCNSMNHDNDDDDDDEKNDVGSLPDTNGQCKNVNDTANDVKVTILITVNEDSSTCGSNTHQESSNDANDAEKNSRETHCCGSDDNLNNGKTGAIMSVSGSSVNIDFSYRSTLSVRSSTRCKSYSDGTLLSLGDGVATDLEACNTITGKECSTFETENPKPEEEQSGVKTTTLHPEIATQENSKKKKKKIRFAGDIQPEITVVSRRSRRRRKPRLVKLKTSDGNTFLVKRGTESKYLKLACSRRESDWMMDRKVHAASVNLPLNSEELEEKVNSLANKLESFYKDHEWNEIFMVNLMLILRKRRYESKSKINVPLQFPEYLDDETNEEFVSSKDEKSISIVINSEEDERENQQEEDCEDIISVVETSQENILEDADFGTTVTTPDSFDASVTTASPEIPFSWDPRIRASSVPSSMLVFASCKRKWLSVIPRYYSLLNEDVDAKEESAL